MKQMKLWLALTLIFVVSSSWGRSTEDHLTLSQNKEVFYKYSQAQEGKPTVVLLNGLIYPLKYWNEFFRLMSQKGYGVIQLAYSTQPESLRLLSQEPYYRSQNLETEDLAQEVLAVVDHLRIKKFHLMTLSYGSIPGSEIANRYYDRLESLTFIAPAVRPSHRYLAYGESRHQYYNWLKAFNPLADSFYDLELYNTMRALLTPQQSTYDLEGVGFENFFHGVYQMARSAKWFDLKDHVTNSHWPRTAFVLASQEEQGLGEDQVAAWEKLKISSHQGVMILVDSAPHAIPGVFPKDTAKIASALIQNKMSPGEHIYRIDSDDLDEGSSSSGSR